MPRFFNHSLAPIALVGVLAFVSAQPSEAANLYRWKDANGNPVIGRSIPPQFVDDGYEVLNEQMRVIKVVPPALRGEALQKKLAEEEKLRRLAELDEFLMLNYNTPDEIEEARDRKVTQLALFVDTKQKSIERTRQDLADALKDAANQERRGKEVTPQMLANIEALKLRIADGEKQLENMREELVEVRMNYADMIERMYYLLGLQKPELIEDEPPAADAVEAVEDIIEDM